MRKLNCMFLHEDKREPGVGGGAEALLRDQTEALLRLGHDVAWWHGDEPLRDAIKEFKPDICHIGTIHNFIGVDPALYLQQEHIPHVWSIMDYYPFCGSRMMLRNIDESCNAVEGVCDQQCEHSKTLPYLLEVINGSPIIALNEYTAQIYRRNGLRCDFVVELGVDTNLFAPTEEYNPDVPVFTSCAWPEYPQKGMPILARALEGTDIQAGLISHQPRSVVARLLKQARIYVSPSNYEETWGLGLNEALASGCACIATDVAGSKAQITDGYDGIIIPKHNPEVMREAITELVRNVGLQQFLGHNARKHNMADHSLEAMGKRLEAVYQEVLNGNHHSNPTAVAAVGCN